MPLGFASLSSFGSYLLAPLKSRSYPALVACSVIRVVTAIGKLEEETVASSLLGPFRPLVMNFLSQARHGFAPSSSASCQGRFPIRHCNLIVLSI